MRDGDEQKTTSKTKQGLYEWLVVPFGLSSAPSTFMRQMNKMLRPYIGLLILVYFADILVCSKIEQDHIKHLKQVFSTLREQKLYRKLEKCQLFVPRVIFLGYVVFYDGIQVYKSKVGSIRSWPVPTSVTTVISFHALTSFYRRFIKDFNCIMAAMIECMKKWSFSWSLATQKAFKVIKQRLCEALVLTLPNIEDLFEVECYAS